MTVSQHVYAAYLIGSPDVALKVKGGRIQLDAGRAPHVRGNIEIAVPSLSTLTALDPRLNKRIRVDVTATFPTVTQTRSFNLGLRDRNVNHSAGTLTLTVASDEALLSDYSPLADDLTPFNHQSSLRAVVNYVLNEAIPGAALASSPANDADVTTYSDTSNIIPDPSNQGDGNIYTGVNVSLDKADTSWAAHGTKSINLFTPTSADSFMAIGGGEGTGFNWNLRPSRTYLFAATGRVKAALSGTPDPNARRLVVYYKVGGGFPSLASPQLPTTVGTATRVSFVFTVPPDATEAFIRAYHGHTGGEIQWDAFRLSEYTGDPTDIGYFDGSSTDTAGYQYDWTNLTATHNSASTREALIARDPASLKWQAGQNGLDFLHPLVQAAGYRLVCDESRTWTLRNEDYKAPGGLDIRHAVNLIDGNDSIARDSGLWFDAAVTTYTWIDDAGATQTRVDAYSLIPAYTRLATFEKSTPYPGAGFSEYAVRRAQGRGREVSATAVSDWTARAEQNVTIVTLGAPTQVGATQRVDFNLDSDEMTVNTRTTEIGVGAIDLLTGTINALTGTINAL